MEEHSSILALLLTFFYPKYLLLTAVGFWARLTIGLIPHGYCDQGSILGKKKGVGKMNSSFLSFFFRVYIPPLKSNFRRIKRISCF